MSQTRKDLHLRLLQAARNLFPARQTDPHGHRLPYVPSILVMTYLDRMSCLHFRCYIRHEHFIGNFGLPSIVMCDGPFPWQRDPGWACPRCYNMDNAHECIVRSLRKKKKISSSSPFQMHHLRPLVFSMLPFQAENDLLPNLEKRTVPGYLGARQLEYSTLPS